MEDKEKNQLNLPPEEMSAVEEFFKGLNLSFRGASMYFREHPAFLKSTSELKEKLEKVSLFRKVLSIGVTPEDLLLDGKYIKKGEHPYREIAPYLHKRKIKSIKINTTITLQNLGDFVSKVAASLKDIQDGKNVKRAIGDIRGVDIEELDYSPLLETKEKSSTEIWDILFAKNTFLNKESFQYLADNLESVIEDTDKINLGEESVDVLFDNLAKVGAALESLSEEKARNFIQQVFTLLFKMPLESLNKFLLSKDTAQLKALLSKYLEKDFLFSNFIKQLVYAKKYNSLFLNFYNTVFEEEKDEEEMSLSVSQFLKREDFLKHKNEVAESLKELFLKDPANKFVSSLYKNTLSLISEPSLNDSIDEKALNNYADDLKEGSIDTHYFYALMELLFIEDRISDAKMLISKIEEASPFFFEEKDLHPIRDLVELLEQKRDSCEDGALSDVLRKFSRKICDDRLLELILRNMAHWQDTADIEFIVRRIDKAPLYIMNEFLTSKDIDIHHKLKGIVKETMDHSTIALLKNFLAKRPSQFILNDIIDVLSEVPTESSLEVLEEICRNNRSNAKLILNALRAMRLNPFKRKDFFLPFAGVGDFYLRKEAVLSFLDVASREEKADLIAKLFGVANPLGIRDKFIMENIDILLSSGFKEFTSYLAKLAKRRPLFFKAKRDRLRIFSLETLLKVDYQQVKPILPYLLKDSNETLRKMATEFKQKISL
ncbi:MAG: hypothetical protein JW734_05870 [Candidatus Omnitrophica bacterium]|nr:hypothetical protein [Candidatus Omnitrophota bacterium]